MPNSDAVKRYEWSDGNFTFSLDHNNSFYHYLSDFDQPTLPENDGNRALAEAAMNAWASVANISFTENDVDPDIGIYEAHTDAEILGSTWGAIAFGNTISDVDVYINNDDSAYLFAGEKAFTYLHEFGHALGLQHPNATLIHPNGDPSYNQSMTAMSYNGGHQTLPLTPMYFDIRAIQEMYGVNATYKNTNDTYTIDNSNKLFTIWDSGGIDTISATTSTTNNTFDLRNNSTALNGSKLEHGSSVGGNSGTEFWIAYGAHIENVIAGSGNDTIYGSDAFAVTSIGAANYAASDGANNLNGGAGDDVLYGNGGNDYLTGGGGFDTLIGGADNDTYNLTTYYYDPFGGFAPLTTTTVIDDTGILIVNGTVLNGDAVKGLDGLLHLGTYTLEVIGNDLQISSSFGYFSGNQILLKDFTDGDFGITSESFYDDRILGYGYDFFDLINGNIIFSGPNAIIDGGRGDDLIGASDFPTPYLSNVTFYGGTGNDSLNGGLGNDVLYGGEGNDNLQGASGQDTLYGGDGNDLLFYNGITSLAPPQGDCLFYGGNGLDTFHINMGGIWNLNYHGSSTIADFSSEGDEVYILSGQPYILYNAISDNQGNTIINFALDVPNGNTHTLKLLAIDPRQLQYEQVGANGNIILIKRSDINLIDGTSGNNNLTGTTGRDYINGFDGNDALISNVGNDTLDGGLGNDSMNGGAGDDVYILDSTRDKVIENLNEGIDTVQSSVFYTLTANVENLTLTGTSGISGAGNALDNIITGNGGANQLYGNTGNDTLLGGEGNDALRGDAGADSMVGGLGNDSYYVDNIGDSVLENLNEGTDKVFSSISFTLTDNIENLTLTGTNAIDGMGNQLANTIIGTIGNNVIYGFAGNDALSGGDGNDTLFGGADNDTLRGNAGADSLLGGTGNDTYYLDDIGDVVTEYANEGTDRVYTTTSYTMTDNIENLTLTGTLGIDGTGNALNNSITGNAADNNLYGLGGNDTIQGSAGNDDIFGGSGIDRLSGGIGNDIFHFSMGDSGVGTINRDIISDFAAGSDKISIDDISNMTWLNTAAFNGMGAAEGRYYDVGASRILAFDLDGNGAADLEVQLTSKVAVTASDFI